MVQWVVDPKRLGVANFHTQISSTFESGINKTISPKACNAMPSRVSARASSATSTRKASAQASAPAVFIPEEPPTPTFSPNLRSSVIEIFSDSQRSTAGHRKLVVRLRKIQEGCCGIRPRGKNGRKSEDVTVPAFEDGEGDAEKEFNTEVSRCILRVLIVRKSEGAGERVIKFLGTFLKTAADMGELGQQVLT